MYGTLLVDDQKRLSTGYASQYRSSVASAEGFQPREFHSTRDKRAKFVQSTMDFMDSEDRFSYEQQQRVTPTDRVISSDSMLDELLKSNRINAENAQGYSIMQKWGWSWGSGIGPKQLRFITRLDGASQTFEFRPENNKTETEISDYNYKFYGLGYGVQLPELSQISTKKRKKVPMNISMAGNLDENEEDEEIQLPRKRANTSVKFQSKRKKISNVEPFRILEKDSFGNPPLNGFILSTLNVYDPKIYAEAPEIDVKTEKSEEEPALNSSVFSFMSEAQRNKIAELTGNQHLPAASPQLEFIPELPRDTALTILNQKSLPYGGDPAKQARYIEYLQDQAGIKSEIQKKELPLVNHFSELQEFYRVAMVFRPLVGTMANRFVSATETSSFDDKADITEKSGSLPASNKFVFSTKSWMPTSLLAKRTGVPFIGKKSQKESVQETWQPFMRDFKKAAAAIYGDSEDDDH